jgi:hypothetical protein
LCANCNISSIVELDLLGRIANVGDQKILLSSCCASLIYYKGSGNEYNTICGDQCARINQFSKGRSHHASYNYGRKGSNSRPFGKNYNCVSKRSALYTAPVATIRPHCYVCAQKNVVYSFELLHILDRRMVQFHLCSKHNLSRPLIDSLGDEQDLIKALKVNKKMP